MILTLQFLFAVHGAPQYIQLDNDPEFIAKNIQRWLKRAVVNTLYINKDSPWEKAYVELFDGKLRDKLLNRIVPDPGRGSVGAGRVATGYNHHCPYSSLD